MNTNFAADTYNITGLFQGSNVVIILFLLVILLVTIIIVVKICFYRSGPLRPFI